MLVLWIRLLPLSLGVIQDEAEGLESNRVEHLVAAGLPADLSPALRQAELSGRVASWEKQHRAQLNRERDQIAGQLKSQFTYRDTTGTPRVFLGDFDSYHWLRMADNYLRTGTTCDEITAGQCRDTYANAPVGRRAIYHRSLHIAAIVVIHRLISFFKPNYPLSSSSYFVPVLVGVLGVFPAYALGARLAGELGGLCAALLAGTNPFFLSRSVGSDDDVWNVVIPLFVVWAASEAIGAARRRSQIGFALLAGVMVGLDAATWSGWPLAASVVLLGLAGNLLLELARGAIRGFVRGPWSSAELKRAGLVLALFYLGAGLCATLAGGDGFGFPLGLAKPLLGLPRASTSAAQMVWPNIFFSVAELAPSNLKTIESALGGPYYFFVGLLGLAALLTPAARAGWRHLALLFAIGVLDACLAVSGLGRVGLIALIAAPLAVALVMELVFAPEQADNRGPALIVMVWFLAALWLSYQGMRFVMLLVAPFALTFGGAMGRLQQWAQGWITRLQPAVARFSRPILVAALATVLIVPVLEGYAECRSYLPLMNGTWWNTLTILHQQSPPDAIVNTWWDYGYWTQYVARRRVNNDGASLQVHVPYWTAAALAAPSDQESAGLWRMLDCGSDATPDPEGKEGAYGKLLAYGVDGVLAPAMITRLAEMNRRQAQAYLAEQGLSPTAQADVLRSTHCRPPVSYLLLTNAIAPVRWWWGLATWDFRRAYVAKIARFLPENRAIAIMASRLGYSKDQARTLYQQAVSLKFQADEQGFISPATVGPRAPWIPCQSAREGVVTCSAAGAIPAGASTITAVRFDANNPADARIVSVRPVQGKAATFELRQTRPAAVVIAGPRGLQSISNPSAESPDVGVLIDLLGGAHVLLGPPSLIRSTLTRLLYLHGRYDPLFEKIHEEEGFGGLWVALFRINWQRLEALE